MSAQTVSIQTLTADELGQAYQGSYYTIRGAGGEASDWIEGYEKLLAEAHIGRPTQWFKTTGGDVNAFVLKSNIIPQPDDLFQNDVTLLMFPNASLHMAKLVLFRVKAEDAWFDDIIDNMKRRARSAV